MFKYHKNNFNLRDSKYLTVCLLSLERKNRWDSKHFKHVIFSKMKLGFFFLNNTSNFIYLFYVFIYGTYKRTYKTMSILEEMYFVQNINTRLNTCIQVIHKMGLILFNALPFFMKIFMYVLCSSCCATNIINYNYIKHKNNFCDEKIHE